MRILPPLPRRDMPELLDGPVQDLEALAENLRDLRRADVLLGATRLIWHELRPLIEQHPGPLTLLDVATGGASLPSQLALRAQRRGRELRAFGSDILIEALRLAQQAASAPGAPIGLICHNALAIPVCDRVVDVATCALALHHFTPEAAAALLRELDRVARRAVLVVDLRRSWPGYLGAQLMARGPWGAMARQDGPRSALRAYTPAELDAIVAVSGVPASVGVSGPLLASITIRRPIGYREGP
jgi:nucleotide-binding universal stress UspA family protein